MIIRMLTKLTENFVSIKKDIETITMSQSEMNIVSKMKHTLEGSNSRLHKAEIESAIWKTGLQKTPN